MARRLTVPLLLLLAVLLAHWGLGEAVWRLRQDWQTESPPPPRIQAAFVRELKPSAPPPARPHLASFAAPPRPAGVTAAVLAPLSAASAPALEPLKPPASAPVALASASASSSGNGAKDDGEPGPEWPLSTRIDYTLTGYYRGEITGSSRVEWLREGAHYQMHLDLVVGAESAPLLSRSMSSDGHLGPNGIEPKRYDETTKILFTEPRQATVRFEPGRVQLADGHFEPIAAGAQDAASQFVHLTWLFLTGRKALQPGVGVDIPLALPRRVYPWRYTVLGEELLNTRYGLLDTWHLRPERTDQATLSNDLSAEVWLAPALQYLPVRILIRQSGDNFVDMLIKSAPLQAVPTSAQSTDSPRSPP
ncbi:MAG: DUF3108 domain-containing protein [Paucibacter sp.]|nr:DUF3108 domain-containing protein [Roseateles sp.]